MRRRPIVDNKEKDVLKRWKNVFEVYSNFHSFATHYEYLGTVTQYNSEKLRINYKKEFRYDDDDDPPQYGHLIVDPWIVDLEEDGLRKYFKLLTEKKDMERTLKDYINDIKSNKRDIEEITEKKMELLDSDYLINKRKKYDHDIEWKENSIRNDSKKIVEINNLLNTSLDEIRKKYTIKKE